MPENLQWKNENRVVRRNFHSHGLLGKKVVYGDF